MADVDIVDLTPKRVDIKLYGTDPWALEVTITALGDLTGATITAKYRPTPEDPSVSLTAVVTDGPASKFTFGFNTTVTGKYDVQVQPSGGLSRTYLFGQIRVQTDVA